MDCREFRNKHVAFVDDLLSAVEMDALQQHLAVCPRCSRQDIAVRRSLMLVRSLPSIEPSPEFMAKLNERLRQLDPATQNDIVSFRLSPSSFGAFAALAAGMVAVAYLAIGTSNYYAPHSAPQIHMPTTVSKLSTGDVSSVIPSDSAISTGDLPDLNDPNGSGAAPMSDAAFVASVPTGMPVWPAVLMLGQAPMHLASEELRDSYPAP